MMGGTSSRFGDLATASQNTSTVLRRKEKGWVGGGGVEVAAAVTLRLRRASGVGGGYVGWRAPGGGAADALTCGT